MIDWDRTTRKISHFRYMDFNVSAVYMNAPDKLEEILSDKPNAKIIHILTHEPRKGFCQVLNEDGSPYLDDFGLEVYMAKIVDWEGEMDDIDEREQERYSLPF